jgi:hypothetical protein
VGIKGGKWLISSHAAEIASDHCAGASARKIRSVDRETRHGVDGESAVHVGMHVKEAIGLL